MLKYEAIVVVLIILLGMGIQVVKAGLPHDAYEKGWTLLIVLVIQAWMISVIYRLTF